MFSHIIHVSANGCSRGSCRKSTASRPGHGALSILANMDFVSHIDLKPRRVSYRCLFYSSGVQCISEPQTPFSVAARHHTLAITVYGLLMPSMGS